MVDLSRLKTLTDELELKYAKFKSDYDELENRYKIIVENLNEGIWQIDSNENTIYTNSVMSNILGYTKEEMLGKSLFYFCPPETLEDVKNLIKRRKEGITETHDFIFVRKDGSHVICLLNASPIFRNGVYSGALTSVTDITKRKEEEFTCKAMADTSFEPMIVHRNGVIIDVNKRLTEISGYSREELIGKISYDFFPVESAVIARKKVKEHSEIPYTMKLAKKDGTINNYEIHGKTLKFNGYSDIRIVTFKEVL